jgi:hypothetical protein
MLQLSKVKHYLFASDFDQTLSFHDSGRVLSELLGTNGFEEKIAGLSRIHLVQQGGELSYLLLHDPEYRQVRREHLVETGKRIRLKHNIATLEPLLNAVDGYRFSFYVISAAPEEVIQSALEGIVPADHIFGTRFHYADSGEIQAIVRVAAQSRRAGRNPRATGSQPGPRGVCRRRQFRRSRDAARESSRRPDHRRIGKQVHHADRAAHRAERRRVERRGAGAGRDRRLGFGTHPPFLRRARLRGP